jgi:hypothetical protein
VSDDANKKNKTVDPVIMADLLREPDIKIYVDKMTPAELDMYKDLLVTTGIYAQYVKERDH